jgi:GGDEF domain-containing protein
MSHFLWVLLGVFLGCWLRNRSQGMSALESQPTMPMESNPVSTVATVRADLARQRRDVEQTLGEIEQLVDSSLAEPDANSIGEQLLASTRELSDQLLAGYDALRAPGLTDSSTDDEIASDRAAMEEFVQDRLHTRDRYQNPFCLALFQVDGTRRESNVNSRQALAVLKQLIRVTDRAYRMRNDELIVILPETSLEGGLMFAKRCVTLLIDELGTRSFGGITHAIDGDSVRTLLNRADAALYRAKSDDFSFVFSNDGTHISANQGPYDLVAEPND